MIHFSQISSPEIKSICDKLFSIEKNKSLEGKGPIGKFFSEESLHEIMKICDAKVGDSLFLACGTEDEVNKILKSVNYEPVPQKGKIDKIYSRPNVKQQDIRKLTSVENYIQANKQK